MIKRLDEVILHKASKIDLTEVDGRKIDKFELRSIQKGIDEQIEKVYIEQELIKKI